MEAGAVTPPRRSAGRWLADLFHGRPRLQLGTLLAGPIGWLVIGYLGSLAVMLLAGFWQLGELSGEVEHEFTTDNFKAIVEEPVYRQIVGRTVLIAALVTIACVVLAFPLAFYMAKIAPAAHGGCWWSRCSIPLWSGYLVKAYAWRAILSSDGALNWMLDPLGISDPGYGNFARLARHDLPLAAVHGHPDLRRASSGFPTRF